MVNRSVNINKVLGAVFLLAFLFLSCYKTDIDKISDDIARRPDVSLPVGKVELSLTSVPDKDPPFRYSKTLYDTLDFGISDIFTSREEIDSVMFRINLVNEFPAECDVIIFYPEFGQGLDYDRSLTYKEPIVIAPGKIDAEGKSTIPSKKQEDIWLTSNQIDELFTADVLVVRVLINDMIVTQPIKDNITHYKHTVGLGLRAKLVYEQ